MSNRLIINSTIIQAALPIRPWARVDAPELAKWFDEHAAEFNLIYEATKRERFYLPQPDLLTKNKPLTLVRPAAFASVRVVSRNLAARAMLRIGEGDLSAAWNDLRAGLLLSQRIDDLGDLGRLTRVASLLIILHRVQILCDHSISAALASDLKVVLASTKLILPPMFSGDGYERLSGLDLALFISGRREYDEQLSPYFPKGFERFSKSASSWAEVMRKLNYCCDQIALADLMPSYEARSNAMPTVESAQAELRQSLAEIVRDYGEIDEDREEAVQLLAALLLTADVDQLFEVQERCKAQLQLTQVVAAIAEYRAQNHGQLPVSLEELMPHNLPSVPRDFFHDHPLVFRRSADGYLLYTKGRNGKDDLGSNHQRGTLYGYGSDILDYASVAQILAHSTAHPIAGVPPLSHRPLHEQIMSEADDFAIRFPIP